MKIVKMFTVITIVLLLANSKGAFSEEMSSTSFKINTWVVSGGGAPISSPNFQVLSTLGQPTPLMDPDNKPGSPNWELYPGFWYTLEDIDLWKPKRKAMPWILLLLDD